MNTIPDIKTLFDYRKARFADLFAILEQASFNRFLPLNIFFNIDDLMLTMEKTPVPLSPYHFASAVLNFACYFRLFFWNLKIRTNIYFYQNIEDLSINPELKEYIKRELDTLSALCTAIPGVYHIYDYAMPSRIIPFAIDNKSDEVSLVVTYEHFGLFSPYYSENGKGAMLRLAGRNSKVITSTSLNCKSSLHNILALAGCPVRKIPNIKRMNYKRAQDFCVNHNLGYSDFKDKTAELLSETDRKTYLENYDYFDLRNLIERYKPNFFSLNSSDKLTDFYGKEELFKIKAEYFSVVPFDINQLFLGEE